MPSSLTTANTSLQDKQILGDGVVTGYGTIDGRLVYAFSQDYRFRWQSGI